jgi:hypothetical protein
VNEVSSYSAAAVVLAMDSLEQISPAHDIFSGQFPGAGEFTCSLC